MLSAAPVVGSPEPGGERRAEVFPGGRTMVEDVLLRECGRESRALSPAASTGSGEPGPVVAAQGADALARPGRKVHWRICDGWPVRNDAFHGAHGTDSATAPAASQAYDGVMCSV
ncbi:hypothetical protein GCM10010195_36680 [Kitasatospora griseola]|nr:hypothetical protein GCM10010195_36680 [Kitasatospora griseola]